MADPSPGERPSADRLPEAPIDRLVGPFERFLHVEAASGIVLVLATAAALILANSPWADGFLGFWKTKLTLGVGSFEMSHSLKHWINDGLMAVFFFVDRTRGEARDRARRAARPARRRAADRRGARRHGRAGGIYLALQHEGAAARGWGIPMATDIAFVVGCLAVLGSRVPPSLRVLLLSLAIVDDIGAILVIAIGYTDSSNQRALVVRVRGARRGDRAARSSGCARWRRTSILGVLGVGWLPRVRRARDDRRRDPRAPDAGASGMRRGASCRG